MTTTNKGTGMKMAVLDIVIGNVSTAIEMDIMESRSGIGSSGSHMGIEMGSGSSTVRERETGTCPKGTIGTETMVAPVVGHCAWRGNSMRNIGGTTIGATSSGTMMSMVTVKGVKRACLLAGAGAEVVGHGKTLAVALHQRGGRQLPKGVFPCHSTDTRPLDGTSMCQGMSSILPCRRSKLVGESLHMCNSSDYSLL